MIRDPSMTQSAVLPVCRATSGAPLSTSAFGLPHASSRPSRPGPHSPEPPTSPAPRTLLLVTLGLHRTIHNIIRRLNPSSAHGSGHPNQMCPRTAILLACHWHPCWPTRAPGPPNTARYITACASVTSHNIRGRLKHSHIRYPAAPRAYGRNHAARGVICPVCHEEPTTAGQLARGASAAVRLQSTEFHPTIHAVLHIHWLALLHFK